MRPVSEPGRTYAGAGVDIEARGRAVARIRELARETQGPQVLAGVGPFSALYRLEGYRQPVLVSSTDGVGTKLVLAQILDRYEALGEDLVHLCVNDILTAGAQPLFFLDYIANNGLTEEQKVRLVSGMARACRAVGCALVGGETADMPDVYRPGDFDLAGFVVGVVERDEIPDPAAVREGDVLLGVPSAGIHTNGYALIRDIFRLGKGLPREEEREILARPYAALGGTLGEALLAPHRSYYREVQAVRGLVKGIAHITGGGLPENVPRVLPEDLAAEIETARWTPHPIFALIQEAGGVSQREMYRTFNMGVGLVLVAAPERAAAVQAAVPEARVIGRVVRRRGPEGALLL